MIDETMNEALEDAEVVPEQKNAESVKSVQSAIADEIAKAVAHNCDTGEVDEAFTDTSLDAEILEEVESEVPPAPVLIPNTDGDKTQKLKNEIHAGIQSSIKPLVETTGPSGPARRPAAIPAAVKPEPIRPLENPQNETSPVRPPQPKKAQPASAQKPAPKQQNLKESQAAKKAAVKKATKKLKTPKKPAISAQLVESTFIADLLERRKAALPAANINLRKAERDLSMSARIERTLNIFRYIIIAVMCFALGGRKFSWMLLGFLGGESGLKIIMALTVAAALLSFRPLRRSIRDIFYARASIETFLLIVTLIDMAETYALTDTKTLLPIVAMAWCACGIAEYQTEHSNLKQLRNVITGRNRQSIVLSNAKWENVTCIGKGKAASRGFIQHQAEPDVWHNCYALFFPILLLVCLILGAFIAGRIESSYLTVLAQLLTVGCPIAMITCCSRPYERLADAVSGKGAVTGWFGIRNLSRKKMMLVYDSDVFPKEAISHKGVKVYGRFSAQAVISMAASIMLKANTGLNDVFVKLLRENYGQILDVSFFKATEVGAGGYISGIEVEVGSSRYMQLIGIKVPQDAPAYGVFVAVNGELAGVIAISYSVKAGYARVFSHAANDFQLTPLIATRNFNVNPAFLRKHFRTPESKVICPKFETRTRLSDSRLTAKGVTCGYTLRDGIPSYVGTILSARRVYRFGFVCSVISMLFTAVLTVMTAIALLNGTPVISGLRLVALNLLFYIIMEIVVRLRIHA